MGDYRIDLQKCKQRATVSYKGLEIASSHRALQLLETNHDPVYYFPKQDVNLKVLESTQHQTHCPFKGDARYWSLTTETDSIENIAWCYESPFPGVAEIAGHLAFYLDQLEIEIEC